SRRDEHRATAERPAQRHALQRRRPAARTAKPAIRRRLPARQPGLLAFVADSAETRARLYSTGSPSGRTRSADQRNTRGRRLPRRRPAGPEVVARAEGNNTF